MNSEFRKHIINECLKNGKIGTITFIKKSTNKERIMNCRFKRKKERVSEIVRPSTETITVWDIPNKQYKSINVETIKSISARGEVINFGN